MWYTCHTERGETMYNRRPIMDIMSLIHSIIKEKGYSARSMSESMEALGFESNRGKIDRAFYSGKDKQVYIQNLDDTIEGVLAVFGMTAEDLYEILLKKERESIPDELQEIVAFTRKPEAIPYLKLAYAQYKAKKASQEVERMQRALKITSPK